MTQNRPEAPTENPSGAPGPDHGTDPGPRVTRDEVRDLGRLRRTRHDRHVAGVAGGLARHLDIDPIILRVAFVVLAFFGGAGLIVYAACWLLVPEEGAEEATVRLDDRSRAVALVLVGGVAALALLGDSLGDWSFPWPLAIIALVVVLVLTARGGRAPRGAGGPHGPAAGEYADGSAAPYAAAGQPARPRNPRRRGPILFWFTLALVALALGVLGVVDAAPAADIPDSAYPALALATIGVMLLIGAFYGRAGGLIFLGLVAAVATAGATAADEIDGGRIDETPASAAAVEDRYELFAGEIRLDLSEVRDPANLDGRDIDLQTTFGRIVVTVPDDVDVEVDANVQGGETRLFGDPESHSNSLDHDSGEPAAPRLTIDAEVVFGEIVVDTEGRTD